jgi:cellulose synthase/poly-beta-1,6-N-acetylglucosamine synthase-like glycosyltransferase
VNKISIIIVNKNDRGIVDTLLALTKITVPRPYEIIVVDASAGKLDDIKNKFNHSVKWYDFKQPNTRKRTIPSQRNYGIKHSTGNIIVFIDANCIPSRNWLKNLTDPIVNHGEEIVAGGIFSKTNDTLHDRDSRRLSKHKYIQECATMNVAFSRGALFNVGLFNEQMNVAEDIELSRRMIREGYKIRYILNAKVFHDWGNNVDEFKRAYRYGYGRAKFYKKHPDNWTNLFKNDIGAIIYPCYLLGLPTVFYFWPYILLVLIPIFVYIGDHTIKRLIFKFIFAAGVIKGVIYK